MKKEDFMFTIGYQSLSALVDADAKKRYAKLSDAELLEKGLYKAAFCSALFDSDEERMKAVLDAVNSQSEKSYDNIDQLKRLFGVFSVPQDIDKAIYLKQ